MGSATTTVYKRVANFTKIYPDYAKFFLYNDTDAITMHDFFSDRKPTVEHQANISPLAKRRHYLEKSLNRTRTKISDIVVCNKFEWFITFTFNPDKTDRFDVELCKHKLQVWLNNQRAKHGTFDYLIVPEYHKNGALHFHAMFRGYKGNLKPTNVFKKSRQVYNVSEYRLGFTEAYQIGTTEEDHKAVSLYLRKYITKDMVIFKDKKRYMNSKGLIRPVTVHDTMQDSNYTDYEELHTTPSMKIWQARIKNVTLSLPLTNKGE